MPSPPCYVPGTVFGELKGGKDQGMGRTLGPPGPGLCSPGLCGEPLGFRSLDQDKEGQDLFF